MPMVLPRCLLQAAPQISARLPIDGASHNCIDIEYAFLSSVMTHVAHLAAN